MWLLIRRAREERLPQVAGSLTFTTVLAAVPLLAASFALFTHFPVLRDLQQALHDHLLRSLRRGTSPARSWSTWPGSRPTPTARRWSASCWWWPRRC